MRTVDEVSTRLRARGMRVTPQRQAIVRLLAGNVAHPTVDALYEAAAAEMPTISRKTVYQTVHDLAALGEVSLLDVGTGALRVDPNVEVPHHHLVCDRCGRVRDVPSGAEPLHLPAQFAAGFSVERVEVNYRGVCGECAAADRGPDS